MNMGELTPLLKTIWNTSPGVFVLLLFISLGVLFFGAILFGKIDVSVLSKKRRTAEKSEKEAKEREHLANIESTRNKHIIMAAELAEIGKELRELGRKESSLPFDIRRKIMDEVDEAVIIVQELMQSHMLKLQNKKHGGRDDIMDDRPVIMYEAITWLGLEKCSSKFLSMIKKKEYWSMTPEVFLKAKQEGTALLGRGMTLHLNAYWRGTDIPTREKIAIRGYLEEKYKKEKNSDKLTLVLTGVLDVIENFHELRVIKRQELFDWNQAIMKDIGAILGGVFESARRIGMEGLVLKESYEARVIELGERRKEILSLVKPVSFQEAM